MTAPGGSKPVRLAAVVLVAALLAFQVIRTAAVADRSGRPALADVLWPSHPAVLVDRSLLAIAGAAGRTQPVAQDTREDVRRIAARAPLSPEPFLIEGAIAESEGRGAAGEQLLLAARNRDPRSRGTRFLLADRFIRTGRVIDGLIEMQALVSLQSRGAEAFSPALVAYARTPGAVPQLRAFFSKYPRVEAGVLSVLATDAANADLVLALKTRAGAPDPDWRRTLVTALANAGQYRRAYAVWARLSGVRPSPGLFNADFAQRGAPPPFNWLYAESPEGVAEPDDKGGLSVLYYGRAAALLASELLVLPPGTYRLAASVDSSGGEGAIQWEVRCANDRKVLLDLPLKAGAIAGTFSVPQGCEAQWLELQGRAGDTPQMTEPTVRRLQLSRVAGR